jgi:hypothetical protein
LHIFKGKFNYSNSLTLENKILIVASIFLSDGILGVTTIVPLMEFWSNVSVKKKLKL